MAGKALVPVEQKEGAFYENMITAASVEEDGRQEVFVSIRQLCELFGVTYQGPMRRINVDPVLSKQVKGGNVAFTPSGDRGVQEPNCLLLDF